MEGKRFGIGLVAGLLLGIGIIAASGGLGALSAGTPFSSSGPQGGLNLTTSTVATTVSRTGTTTSTGQPGYVAVGNLSSAVTSTTAATPGSTPQTNLKGLTTSGSTTPSYASNVQNIAHQPLSTDAVVFVPVLLAFLLGAVLYRTSNRNQEGVPTGK